MAKFFVTAALLVGVVTVECAAGSRLSSGSVGNADPSVRSKVRRRVCDFKHHLTMGDDYGASRVGVTVKDLRNGSIQCDLSDDKFDLFCMGLIKYMNSTDEFGNTTYTLVVMAQGCWTRPWNDLTQCLTENECVTTQSRSLGPTFPSMCCCRNNRCNRESALIYLPYDKGNSKEIGGGVLDDGATGDIVTLIVALLLSLLFLSGAIIAVYYVYRKRRQSIQKAAALQLKVDQYNYNRRTYSEEPPVINYDDLTLEDCIHRGRFGEVYKAQHNNREVCVKYFHAQQRSLFITEKEIYGVLDPSVRTVVRCLICDERSHPDGSVQYIVIMEYVSLGALSAYLRANTLSWRELCSMAQTAAAGIGYLHGETLIGGAHKHAIVHRDLNSRNILLRSDMTCAIADMGFAMKIRGSKVIRNGIEEHAEDGSLRDVGTVRYMAPEILDCAVNLRDCESSLKQIDMYAFSLVLWELVTRCRDILFETKRFMLPFEEELNAHPTFEVMRIHVAKEHHRPLIPVTLKHTDATRLLRETIEECWDTDAEARLSALCVEERFRDMDALMECKGVPNLSKNEIGCEKRRRLSSSNADIMCRDYPELSPLLETDTPASESTGTVITYLGSPDQLKPDVNIDMERDRMMGPARGRNILAERNTLQPVDTEDLAVHENTLIPLQEAKARQAAEEERSKRQWEEQQQQVQQVQQAADAVHNPRLPRPPARTVQLDIRNEVRDQPAKVKENNLNVRRHNSQRNLNESSTSSNGGAGMILTIPECNGGNKRDRPRSLNLNIKPESS